MSARRTKLIAFLVGGLLVSLLLAGVVSNFTSSSPDGLDSATVDGCSLNSEDEIASGDCAATKAEDHELAGGPLAGYAVKGIDNEFVATGLSGVIGVLLVFAIGGGLFWLVRRRGAGAADSPGA
jgi:cobalt/nickel transport protein